MMLFVHLFNFSDPKTNMISTFSITGHSVYQGDIIHILIVGQCLLCRQ